MLALPPSLYSSESTTTSPQLEVRVSSDGPVLDLAALIGLPLTQDEGENGIWVSVFIPGLESDKIAAGRLESSVDRRHCWGACESPSC